jgi:hypothetical protein
MAQQLQNYNHDVFLNTLQHQALVFVTMMIILVKLYVQSQKMFLKLVKMLKIW